MAYLRHASDSYILVVICLIQIIFESTVSGETECTGPKEVICQKVGTAPILDGDLSDWESVDSVTTPITGALSGVVYPGGDMSIKCSFDSDNLYFAISVPGKYRFSSTDDHICAAISTMMKIGKDAEYINMGGCPLAMAGCPLGMPEECKSYTVDVGAHWELKTSEQGERYGMDVSTESGNDLVANKDDEFAVSSYCRKDDFGEGSGNEWSGAWVHNVDTSKSNEYTTVNGTDGTYTFEISRTLSTNSPDTDVQLEEGGTYEFGLAYWDPYEFENIGWTKVGHYVTGCSKDWMNLVVGDKVSKDVSFSSSIGFTQYKNDCDGEKLYEGSIDSISMLETGLFCVTDTIMSQDGSTSTIAYSKLDVVSCSTDKIYDHWYKCTDDTCSGCEMEYRSYTAWNSFEPDDMMDQCYTYNFSMDDDSTVKEERSEPSDVTVGSFEDISTVSFNFNDDTNEDDVAAYINLIKDNSCVAFGKFGKPLEEPVVGVVSKDNTTATTDGTTPGEPAMPDPDISSSNVAVFSNAAALVMTLATSMLFV